MKTKKPGWLKGLAVVGLTLVSLFAWGVPGAQADIKTLTDLNTTVVIDPHSDSGAYSWTVDGVDHLFQQWFWFRINGVGGTGKEVSIDTLPVVETTFLGTRGLELDYTNAGKFALEILYTLTGGLAGSGTSDIAETIRIDNTKSSGSLSISFFQYTDLDLSGTSGDDTVTRTNQNTMRQSDPFFTLSETVVAPRPSRFELAFFSTTRDKLTDGGVDDLASSNTAGSVPPVGPGDATWAWQWNLTIPHGGSVTISKDKNIRLMVSQPATLLLLGVSLVGLAVWGKRHVNRKRNAA